MAPHGLSRPPGPIVRTAPVPHDRLAADRVSGVLHLALETPERQFVSPGTGRLVLVDTGEGAIVAHQGARAAGKPILPGTGIKGAVRTLFELLSFSCDPLDPGSRCSRGSCCDACSVFGFLGWSGRISFHDAAASGTARVEMRKVPVPWEPKAEKTGGEFRLYDLRTATTLDPERRQWVERRKELAREVFTGGFAGAMSFWNLTEDELGRLLYGMGAGVEPEARFHLRLGGAKYDGKGAVRITPTRLRLVSPHRETLENKACTDRCARWMALARGSAWGKTFWPTLTELARTLESED